MKHVFVLLLLLLSFFLAPSTVFGKEVISCDNRFVTLVNPVRGRELWGDKTLVPLLSQYNDSFKYKKPATWLLQYDALIDKEITDTIKAFEIKGERGVFLEVSKTLADKAGIEFNTNVRWSHPGIVFLSAYKQSERRRLIDTIYKEFKDVFGEYPKSVGAWWIDSYSINYIKEKYGLSAVMIVADQKSTDSYGVWGQWWGYPYAPSISNILLPATDNKNELVVIQWAQRDPILAYGPDAAYSNFSLQANDYIRNGKDTKYFRSLVETYLDCKNDLGQITIGMETGMEALSFSQEYKNQLRELNSIQNLSFVTMSEFSSKYNQIFKSGNDKKVFIEKWTMDVNGRSNPNLGDSVSYTKNISFNDYFLPDESAFLGRDLENLEPKKTGGLNITLILVLVVSFVISLRLNKIKIWLSHLFFTLASFGLLFLSREIYGWRVYYGLKLDNIYIWQVAIYVTTLVILFYLVGKLKKQIKNLNLFLLLLPLSFGIDGVLSIIRVSRLSEQYLLGVTLFKDRIFGILFGDTGIKIINKWFPVRSSDYFYKVPYDYFFSNGYLYILTNPLIHALVAIIFFKLLENRNKKVIKIVLITLSIFYLVFLTVIFSKDPVSVTPIK